jgi:hypothetical protein
MTATVMDNTSSPCPLVSQVDRRYAVISLKLWAVLGLAHSIIFT